MTSELVDRLSSASSIAVLTGAGISAESGIATFRDPGGLWQKFKPEELANINAFLKNPSLVQAWYAERRRVTTEALPNPGHIALAQLENKIQTTVITQNVDGLHLKAGSTNLIELHGNILRSYCIDCSAPASQPDETQSTGEETDLVRCTTCGGLIRPDVVWFGEMLPPGAIEQAATAARECDIFLTIGTGAEVFPAAELPLVAKRNGAYVVEMNTGPTAISNQVDELITGPAGRTVPALVDKLTQVRTDITIAPN